MTSEAGKGPEIRKGANLKNYWANFPDLSRGHKSKAKKVVKKKGKTTYTY